MSLEMASVASLVGAIAAVWVRQPYLWTMPFALFILFGLISGWLTPAALVSGSLYAAVVWFFVRASTRRSRILSTVLLIIGALVLGVHLAPGFEQTRVLTELAVAGRPDWNGIGFSADKPLVGLFLSLAYRDRLCLDFNGLGSALARVALPMLLGIGGVYAVGIALGYVVLEPFPLTLPLLPLLLALFVRNLFFTVVAEEMLFRQVIQSGLERSFRGEQARWHALLTSSVLFGAVHLPGGWQFGLLATLAGLVYGYAYLRSARVETAILPHVALNTGNVLLFAAPGS